MSDGEELTEHPQELGQVHSPILIAGMPKSATTALAAVVSAASGGRTLFEPKTFEQARTIDDCRVIKIVYPQHDPRTLTEVMQEFAPCEKRVWITRDPRDQLVSIFLYTWYRAHRMPEDRFRTALDLVRRKEAGERIPFSTLLVQTFGPKTYYHDPAYYLDRVMPYFRSVDAALVFKFSYDELVTEDFGKLSGYLGLDLVATDVHPDHQRVVRSKASGSWRSWFEPEDTAELRPFLLPYMQEIGIPDEWDTVDSPPGPKNASYYMLWLRAGGKGPRPDSVDDAEAALQEADRAERLAQEEAMRAREQAAAQTMQSAAEEAESGTINPELPKTSSDNA